MRAVTDLITSATSALASSKYRSSEAPIALDGASAEVVNRLFRELQSIFPAWRTSWPDDFSLNAAKRSWVKAFASAGITDLEQIRFGIERCRLEKMPFIPSSGTFIDWCQPTPEMLGLPDARKAYREACRNAHPSAAIRWSHPAVEHAACETGLHELRTLTEVRSRILFERNYAIATRMVVAGQPLREIPLGLPDPHRHEAGGVRTPEVGRDALAALRAKVAK